MSKRTYTIYSHESSTMVCTIKAKHYASNPAPAQHKETASSSTVESISKLPSSPHSTCISHGSASFMLSLARMARKVQCSGVTGERERCKHQKNSYGSTEVRWYCRQHEKQSLPITSKPTQVSSDTKRAERNQFLHNFVYYHPEDESLDLVNNRLLAEVYVDPSLPAKTWSKLVKKITTPASAADAPGFIYCYQRKTDTSIREMIRGLLEQLSAGAVSTPRERVAAPNIAANNGMCTEQTAYVGYKIGRAVNVRKRMSQWSRKCGMPIDLLGVFPEQPSALQHQYIVGTDPKSISNGTRETSGLLSATPTPMASLVESLIHIHLSDESFGRVQSPCNCSIKHREWFKDGDGILWQHSNIRLVILYYIKLVRLMYETQ